MKKRIKISASYNDFIHEINGLRSFNNTQQHEYALGNIKKSQFYMMNENIFFNAHRAYENFVKEIFVLYTQEKRDQMAHHPSHI